MVAIFTKVVTITVKKHPHFLSYILIKHHQTSTSYKHS